MNIRVVFYGGLKQDAGVREETLHLPQDVLTMAELADVLRERYPALRSRLATAAYVVNDEIVPPGYCLHDGDEASLLPPVSGG